MYPRCLPCGDRALLVEFGDQVDLAINRQVNQFATAVRALALPGVIQVIPTYCSAMVEYDPERWPSDSLDQRLAGLLGVGGAEEDSGRLIEIPTWYAGPDLQDVAAHTGLPVAEVIGRHSGGLYTVYAVGFSPGFAYMGGLAPALATPRIATPRIRVPAGSVAIGGQQTGVYPAESPGGWRLLGLTSVKLFDPGRPEPALLRAGDRVRFVAISEAEYRRGCEPC
ncbi:MAG TPA: 5-oxoprolinase subunit PxpB [Symbiobacteriaceae bacterium]|jgi:KipI family sensor histidine kinase inhibitor